MSQNIHVLVRLRPHNKNEASTSILISESSLTGSPTRSNEVCLQVKLNQTSSSSNQNNKYKQFHPNAALGPGTEQHQVWVSSLCPQSIDSALLGFKTTIFAYGQTGAGKTFTVLGSEGDLVARGRFHGNNNGEAARTRFVPSETDGILPRSVFYLFNKIEALRRVDGKVYTVRLSALEIYNEQAFDLLRQSSGQGGAGDFRLHPLSIREHKVQGFYVDKLTGVKCKTSFSAIACLAQAIGARRTGSHLLNHRSSRSHLLVTLYIDSQPAANTAAAAKSGFSTFGRVCIVSGACCLL
jgi:hypothetical protein